jgi:hypothetical protein
MGKFTTKVKRLNKVIEMNSSVLFIVFNRPEQTAKVFSAIRDARPPKIYIAADGPRFNVPDDDNNCLKVRNILSQIDWPCEVYRRYAEHNHGCKIGVSSAINWFFENENEGIILEDDCLPRQDFFLYCDSLLERYRNDERIGLISGMGLMDLEAEKLLWHQEDYVYSRYPSIWGWATWRRVWKDYDVCMEAWPENRIRISEFQSNRKIRKVNDRLLTKVYKNEIDTWDYQVSYLLWSTARLSIIPKINLISNIGFDDTATHTKWSGDRNSSQFQMSSKSFNNIPSSPKVMIENKFYQSARENFANRSNFSKLVERIGRFFHG